MWTAVKWCQFISHHPGHGLLPASASLSSYKTCSAFSAADLNYRQKCKDRNEKPHKMTNSNYWTFDISDRLGFNQFSSLFCSASLIIETSSGGRTHSYRAAGSALLPHSRPPRGRSSEGRGQTERCPGLLEKSCLTTHVCYRHQSRPGAVYVKHQKAHDSYQRWSWQYEG